VFPREGAFAGPGDASMLHLKDNAFSILWRSSDGSEIKVKQLDILVPEVRHFST
jgi:hypothetical protein